ncbi:protein Largen-like, partial [Chiloscyllium plagiosum]|uniref:protein Largen-like n=1 Tax=Chiloscyllium plagiosum TaxID=36176 RepID=UPI001CB82C65
FNVAFILKQVVGQIDHLTSDLNLSEDANKSYKSDTLDSSSSGVTVSTLEKSKDRPKMINRTAPTTTAVLTVLRKSKPPPPPPRRTPVRVKSPAKTSSISNSLKINGAFIHNGAHSPADQLMGNNATCSSNVDKLWVQENQTDNIGGAGETKPLTNTVQNSQRPSKYSLYPTFNTKYELPVQQKDVSTANVHCCTRSQLHPCLDRRSPIFCNTSISTTSVGTSSHPKNPRTTVRKHTSTTV